MVVSPWSGRGTPAGDAVSLPEGEPPEDGSQTKAESCDTEDQQVDL